MKFFADSTIKPYLAAKGYSEICEIGASLGENTDKILELGSVSVTIVDPCVDAHLPRKYEGNPRVKIHKGLSLEVLPVLPGAFDCFLIDGDHNWYTVYNELRLIRERGLLKPGGVIFLHDVGWPYGRRDMYYEPERVPPAHRQPYARKGIVPGRSMLDAAGANAQHDNALTEGGPRNGVLTAIEDFVRESGDYVFFRLNQEFGLGVLAKKRPGDRVFSRFRRRARLLNWTGALRRFVRGAQR
ncbi:MAG: hypothetical protein K0Q91_1236 [Fibrobacteria bacterium]|jgi:hypothetical protein|nr:hypothetical protein [Fibrobacteria bacterium]